MGDMFKSQEFSLERCRPQVPVGKVIVGEMWVTGSSSE